MKLVLSRITTTVSVIALLSFSYTGAGIVDNDTYGEEYDSPADYQRGNEEGYRQDELEGEDNDDQEQYEDDYQGEDESEQEKYNEDESEDEDEDW